MCVHVWTSVSLCDWWWPLPKHTAHLLDNDFPWWLHQVKMLEEMGRGRRKRRRGGESGCLKEGLGKEGMESGKVWRGDEGDDGPPGTRLKSSPLPNLLLYFEKQQEGCQRRKEAGDGWSDMRALTDLMNGLSTLAKWLHHHEETGANRKDKGLSITRGQLH